MKGLLIKEFYILKKDLIMVYGAITLLIFAMNNLIGNHDGTESGYLIKSVSAVFAPVAVLSIGMITSSFRYDSKCGHEIYSVITPVTRKEYVLSKMLLLLILSVISGIWLYGMTLLSFKIDGFSFCSDEVVKSLVLAVFTIFFALYGGIMNIYYHIRKGEEKWIGSWLVLIGIEYVVFCGFTMRFSEGKNISFIFPVLFAVFTAATVFFFIGSIKCSEEKEF